MADLNSLPKRRFLRPPQPTCQSIQFHYRVKIKRFLTRELNYKIGIAGFFLLNQRRFPNFRSLRPMLLETKLFWSAGIGTNQGSTDAEKDSYIFILFLRPAGDIKVNTLQRGTAVMLRSR
jgi:hypothetical protein